MIANPRKIVVCSSKAPTGTGPYSPGLKTGDTLYVSGQGPLNPQTHEIVGETIEEQTKLTLENMIEVVRAAGLDASDIVKVNVYLARMADYEGLNATYRTFFSDPYPTRTTIACGLLDILVEIDCVAIVGAGGR